MPIFTFKAIIGRFDISPIISCIPSFYYIVDQINAALVSIRDLFHIKNIKILIIPNFSQVVYTVIYKTNFKQRKPSDKKFSHVCEMI